MANDQNKMEGVENTLEEEKLSKMTGDTDDDTRDMLYNNGDMVDMKGDGVFNETLGVATPNDQIAEDIEDRKTPSPFEIDIPEPKPGE
ncbi:hypothetical protein [Legionella sp. W05-934-2]|jgi:hypothetical protein|uniref:hypothetical protein n=1 Tax=Legionella sp. W05-934-2 TaxID=1198649 RepID=UPI0034633FA1